MAPSWRSGSEYRGDYALPEAEMMAFHRPRVQALLAAGADLLACETLPSFAEAQALVKLLAEFPEGRAWFSFTCVTPDTSATARRCQTS